MAIVGGLLVVSLYFFGNTIPPQTPINELLKEERVDMENTFDINLWIDSLANGLPVIQKDSLNLLVSEKQQTFSLSTLSELSAFWKNNRKPSLVAHFTELAANQQATDVDKWVSAGEQYYIANRLTKSADAKQYFGDKAVATLSKALELEPENNTAQIALASTFIDAKNSVMQGVTLLKQVEQRDSNNLEVNLILGRLSMVSQQYDKVVTRMKKVRQLDSSNTEALYYLGEANIALGNKKEGIQYLKSCIEFSENPAFKAELEQYIKKL